MSTNTNPTSTTTAATTRTGTQPSRGSSIGAGLGSAVKGAFETVQGIGNNIRGNALDFVDSAAGTTRTDGAAHPATDLGRRQAEQGVQRMEAAKQGTTGTATATSTTTGAPPTVGSRAPLPPHALNGSLPVDGTQAAGGYGGTVGSDGMGAQVRSSV